MTQFSVLLGMALLFSIAALSVDGSGVKDQIDPELTAEVEALLERPPVPEPSSLRLFAGLAPIAAEPPEAAPYSGGAPFAAFTRVEDGYRPLTGLGALYGVHGPPVARVVKTAPAPAEPAGDAPVLIASASPPPDAK